MESNSDLNVLVLCLPHPPDGLNENRKSLRKVVTWAIRKKHKEHCVFATRNYLREFKLENHPGLPFKHCRVQYDFRRERARKNMADSDNLNNMMKGGLDALKDAGVIVDDRYVSLDNPTVTRCGPDGRCVFVTITRIEGD